MKNSYFIIVALFILFYVVHVVRLKKLSIKESFWWVIGAIIVLVLSIFPKSIDVIAGFFGVTYPPTLMFVFCILFLLMMNFRNSARVSEQNEKIMELAQQVSILKNKIDKR